MGIDVESHCRAIEAPTTNKFKLSSKFTCRLHNDFKNQIEFVGNTEAITKGQ